MSFFNELKRRNVIKVAAAYIIVGWLLMQVGDTLAPALYLPEWINSALAFFVILGFPLALIFAWAFELTPEGLRYKGSVTVGWTFRSTRSSFSSNLSFPFRLLKYCGRRALAAIGFALAIGKIRRGGAPPTGKST